MSPYEEARRDTDELWDRLAADLGWDAPAILTWMSELTMKLDERMSQLAGQLPRTAEYAEMYRRALHLAMCELGLRVLAADERGP